MQQHEYMKIEFITNFVTNFNINISFSIMFKIDLHSTQDKIT